MFHYVSYITLEVQDKAWTKITFIFLTTLMLTFLYLLFKHIQSSLDETIKSSVRIY